MALAAAFGGAMLSAKALARPTILRSPVVSDHISLSSSCTDLSSACWASFFSNGERPMGNCNITASNPSLPSDRHPGYGIGSEGRSLAQPSASPLDNPRLPVATKFAVDDTCHLRGDTSDFGRNFSSLSAGPGDVARLERSYVTEAVVGRVVCNSKGCRPILCDPEYDETIEEGWLVMEGCSSLLRDECSSEARLDLSQAIDRVWMEKGEADRYFEEALGNSPNDVKLLTVYAEFTWRELGNMDKAEGLYRRALKEAPDNAEALASYALFLWQ